MADQNKSKPILKTKCLENSKNKVYINPNFNRQQINNISSNPTMHFNPKFSHFVSNGQRNIQNKNKIYINPNFMKSRSVGDGNQCILPCANDHVIPDKQSRVNNSLATYQHQSENKEATALLVPVAQSRYCLVRQNVTKKPINGSVLEKAKNTFKLNKYKTVSLKDIKRNLDNVKNVTNNNLTCILSRSETNFQTSMNEKISNSLVLNRRKNELKLINYNNVSPLKQDKIKTNTYTDIHKKPNKSNQTNQLRVKKIKGNLKKNNIPCPLFRKFGKCLRNARGKCEFLHDKKHVSICRKFIKGLCHDKDCLLSHDLTTKKMPTCYFYLQGTCTKAECPYLHVKLNEKTKICPDFVKGYCEKGSECLQRHINFSAEKKNKSTSQIKESFRNNYNKFKIRQVNVENVDHQDDEVFQKIVVKGEHYSENRYYEEHRGNGSTKESCEIIKPMRCKLGTLPSFIQL